MAWGAASVAMKAINEQKDRRQKINSARAAAARCCCSCVNMRHANANASHGINRLWIDSSSFCSWISFLCS